MAEIQKSINDLESEINTKISLLADVDLSNASLGEVQQSIVALDSEYQNNGPLAEIENSNRNQQIQLNEKNSLLVELQKSLEASAAKLIEKDVNITEIENSNRNQQIQLNEKNSLLAELQKSLVLSERELNQKSSSLDEVEKSNRALNLELDDKNTSLTKIENLKFEIEQTIVGLESELNEKDKSLAAVEKINRDLQLEMNEKNGSLAKVKESLLVLGSELYQKKLSLAEREKHNPAVQLSQQNGSAIEFEKLVDLQSEVEKKVGPFAEISGMNPTISEEITEQIPQPEQVSIVMYL